MRTPFEYWKEAFQEGMCEANAWELVESMTQEQRDIVAKVLEGSHECYSMAFYSPPASDRISEIEKEHKDKLNKLQKEYDQYKESAETAVRKALRQYDDTPVSIGKNGEVHRYGGRIERIQ